MLRGNKLILNQVHIDKEVLYDRVATFTMRNLLKDRQPVRHLFPAVCLIYISVPIFKVPHTIAFYKVTYIALFILIFTFLY
jgi:hypothetical protein